MEKENQGPKYDSRLPQNARGRETLFQITIILFKNCKFHLWIFLLPSGNNNPSAEVSIQ